MLSFLDLRPINNWAIKNNITIDYVTSRNDINNKNEYEAIHFLTTKVERNLAYFSWLKSYSWIVSTAGFQFPTEARLLHIHMLIVPLPNQPEQLANWRKWELCTDPYIMTAPNITPDILTKFISKS